VPQKLHHQDTSNFNNQLLLSSAEISQCQRILENIFDNILALEVAVDCTVAGVVCVIDPVTCLAAVVLSTPVTTVVPEANIVTTGDNDEAGNQLAAQPAQWVPVADRDADLVS
jgi:hypothetical protein